MKKARASYTPVKKTTKPTNPKGKIQKGKGAFAGEAATASEAVQALAGVGNNVIASVATDKLHNGRYDKSQFDKQTREVKRLQRLMEKGQFPQLSLKDTLKYVEERYGK